MARRRVHNHAGVLVYDGDVAILLDQLERDCLGLHLDLERFGNADLDDVAGSNTVRGLGRLAVDQDEVALDQPRGSRAAEAVRVVGDKTIETSRGGSRGQALL